MGIYNALFTGASGLTSFGETVRVIGDNIANVNSLGFKAQDVIFSDVLSQTISVSRSNIANQVGSGVTIGSIIRNNAQGSIKTTTNATDMAINGRGMFALRDTASNQTFYSRAGAFNLDKDFKLIDSQGFVVQGWKTDGAGVATGNVADIQFANLAAQAQATNGSKGVVVGVSIDSTATTPKTTTFNPNDPTSFNYKTDVNIFDSLGATHPVSLYFIKTGLNSSGQAQWDWRAAVPGDQLKGADANTPTTPVEIGGTIVDSATPTMPLGTVLSTNTVLASDTVLDQTFTIPKGAITDQAGNSNIAVTWTAGQSLGTILSDPKGGSLNATGLFTLTKAVTPSTVAQTILTAGSIYMPAQSGITNASTTAVNGTLATKLSAKAGAVGNGIGATLTSNAATPKNSAPITFPAGSLQDENGLVNSADITWNPTIKLSAAVNATNSSMKTTGLYTVVGNGDVLTASQTLTYTGSATALPSALNTGATLTGGTVVTGADLVIPKGSLKDVQGKINNAAITVPKGGAALSTLVAAAGLTASTTATYTLVSGISGITSVLGAAGTVTNPEAVFAGAETGTPFAGSSIAIGTNFTGTAKVSADLTFPVGTLMDSAGTTNITAITLPGGGAQLDSLTGAAGLLTTGPYTTVKSTNTTSSQLVAGTVNEAATTAIGVAIPTLIQGATIQGLMTNSAAGSITIPKGGLLDASGAVVSSAASFNWTTTQSLSAALTAAGLTATGPFTINGATATAMAGLNTTILAGASLTNPTTAVTGAVLSGATFPTTLFPGTSLTGNVSVFGSDLKIPAGYLKDSLGNVNASTITLFKGTTNTLNSKTAQAGLSITGPYTLVQSLPIAAGTVKLSTGTVTLQTVLASGEVSNPAATSTGVVGLGPQSLVFDANGALFNEFSPQLTIPWSGANANKFNFDMGSASNIDAQGTAGGQGLDGVIQLAGSFATRQMTRNGFTSGFLDRLETDSTGVISGVFTNGQRRPLYQVALANFPNASALNHTGSNSQQESIASGTPVLEKPSNGGMGSISPFGLEQSNVDLAGEFVKLIIVQRGYEANSKTITTTDQMLGSLMQLKR